jgi:Zn finger protein HypA/HybF involved in hydrogenase expression
MKEHEQRRDARKAAQLGMSYGKASHILVRRILFNLANRLGETICFKCGLAIESAEELSIEHKEPWENRNAALFWDLDNITFSHKKCNRNHSVTGHKLRKIGPDGTAWCTHCGDFRPLTEFRKNTKRWNGVEILCREHKSIKDKDVKSRKVCNKTK